VDDELGRLVREQLGVDAANVVRIDDGWDSIAFDVDDAWIVRVPRRPEVREELLLEAALLPRLAPQLPVPVPAIRVLSRSPEVAVAHPKLHGAPLSSRVAERLAPELGAFLAALHRSDAHVEAGFPRVTAAEWIDSLRAFVDRCDAVLRLLESDERRRAEEMFARQLGAPPDYAIGLVHGDLGPEHILCSDEGVSGVIDWTDARVGDPALDFAWLLHALGTAFGDALLEAYVYAGGSVDPLFRDRALYFHRLGPWHEVLFGLRTGRHELVASGLAGVRDRLP